MSNKICHTTPVLCQLGIEIDKSTLYVRGHVFEYVIISVNMSGCVFKVYEASCSPMHNIHKKGVTAHFCY